MNITNPGRLALAVALAAVALSAGAASKTEIKLGNTVPYNKIGRAHV